ncbi:tRNA lysidine(34) synthetase TilS [Haloferula chungangensis]|uniref:tRNA(Ile)-lysidine synthase n=1 Tax=Haloferula chungangensis TaxID=1048331 RepID=A0ABW2L6K2_9BACT
MPRWIEEASKRRRYLVGVSGGADSVSLLHLLHRSGFGSLVVCHLDHGLRGEESREDARFVEKLAKSLGYAFEGGRVEVAGLARGEKISVETAGRRARHAFFAACARARRCRRLVLAHHGDDQAETVLWKLVRGSRGACGMGESQTMVMGGLEMEIIRPLLEFRRAELRQWLEQENLSWREDPSNAQAIAVRNRIRNEALPLLEDIAKRDPTEALIKAANSDAELRQIEAWAVEQADVIDPQSRIHLPKLRTHPEVIQRACLFSYLRQAGVSGVTRSLVDRALSLTDPESPPVINLPGGRALRRRAGRIWVA